MTHLSLQGRISQVKDLFLQGRISQVSDSSLHGRISQVKGLSLHGRIGQVRYLRNNNIFKITDLPGPICYKRGFDTYNS